MRKALPILVAVLLLGAGVAIGWFASTRVSGPATSPQSGEPESPAEKLAGDWFYPGAKVVSSGSSTTNDATVSFVVQETADDVSKVLEYYRDKLKLGIKLQETGEIVGGKLDGKVAVEYCHAPLKPGAAGGAATVSTFKTKTAVSTLVVCRSPDGKLSTVTITPVPLGGAK